MRQMFNFTGLRKVTAANHGRASRHDHAQSEVAESVDFYNHTGRDLCVIDIHNHIRVIPHCRSIRPDIHLDKLVIIKTFSTTGKSLIKHTRTKVSEFGRQLGQDTAHYYGHAQGLDDCGYMAANDNCMTSYSFHYEYDIDELERSPYIYDESLDIVIFADTGFNYPLHPKSKEALLGKKIPEHPKDHQFADGVFVEIIDNENQINAKWVFMLGKTFRFTPKIDKTKRSGVYIAILSKEQGRDDPPAMNYMTFEEALKERLFFSTEEEAKCNGNLSEVAKKERLDAERSSAETQAKIEKVKEQGNILSNVVKLIAQLLSVVTAIFTTFGGFRRLFGS